jgi:RNA polymerase sigma-70 factor (ECF subfamily)
MNASPDISTLWQQHHDALLAFIRSRVKDREASLDILQEVFVKILTQLRTLRDREKVQSWLYQIARNSIADHYRFQRTVAALSVENEAETSQEDDTAMRHIESCLRPMIHGLPPIYREALLLSEIDGLSQKELALRLGISYSGAKTRVQRGRQLLREVLMACCTFEIDRYGKILDYHPRPQPACATC